MDNHHNAPYLTLSSRRARGDGASMSSVDSTYGSGTGEASTPSATHDISRVSYHVKHLDAFVKTLEDSAGRAFPNRGRSLQRYTKVQVLLLHWKSDDLFVLPELEDLEQCLREDYSFATDIFPIPSENSHLELMLKIGAMIKDHEATDTLFIVYYGGHARIDESRQSTWCATRHSGSPWLQWSAIQTLLERSVSDVLILLDCCAGAASATFPNWKSITETISASSWDAIAPDPGRYSFTNALIEVLQQWKLRTFSAAMLHAEILARLKHPRPVTINGKYFEARSTPVHFMMTSNHKAPSIELGRIIPGSRRPPSPPEDPPSQSSALNLPAGHTDPAGPSTAAPPAGRGPVEDIPPEPTTDKPHVMISLALEDDQRLDLDAWEQWLASFPALARYVKVQGVFRSHSTLLLLSLPVMIWDLLPEDPACSFVAFIRSNNLLKTGDSSQPTAETSEAGAIHDNVDVDSPGQDHVSLFSGTTYQANDDVTIGTSETASSTGRHQSRQYDSNWTSPEGPPTLRPGWTHQRPSGYASTPPFNSVPSQPSTHSSSIDDIWDTNIKNTVVLNQHRSFRRTTFQSEGSLPAAPPLAAHVVARLEEYFQKDPEPNFAVTEIYASNLGLEPSDVSLWFHHRHMQERMRDNLQNIKIEDNPPAIREGARMILPGHLNRLLEIYPSQVLLVDLRSQTDFERSHVYRAAHLRVPLSFVQNATFEMIENAFADDDSRNNFSRWYTSKCVVFYDRVVEFTWECATADALFEKFKLKGWAGQCFILKGHYKEFSSSYDKYIVGSRMSNQAKEYVESLSQPLSITTEEIVLAQEAYHEWLRLVENEGRVPSTNLIPSKKAGRLRVISEHQEALESEFQERYPGLWKKSLSLRPAPTPPPPVSSPTSWTNHLSEKEKKKDDNFDSLQGPLVEPLVRGLSKMQEAGISPPHLPHHPTAPGSVSPGLGHETSFSSKTGAASGHNSGSGFPTDKLGDPLSADEYDEIDPRDEQLLSDPAFQSAGDLGGAAATAARGVAVAGGIAVGDSQKKAQQRGFWKRIRSGKS